jgi:hypothetical protein
MLTSPEVAKEFRDSFVKWKDDTLSFTRTMLVI